MRKLLLTLALLGTAALPASAAPTLQPALAAATASSEATVQTVQYDRRAYLRQQEFRRRQAMRREQFRRRQAARHGYVRPY